MTKTAAIIVAAGNGSRAGGALPKQYRVVNDKPMLRHSVEAFAAHPRVDAIYVVIGDGQLQLAQEALAGLDVSGFIIGGETRRDSVYNGLQQINAEFVLIHDAARPLLSRRIIDDLIAALATSSGAVPALPVIDSIARSDNGTVLNGTADRDGLWRIQTPQAFRREAIMTAHQQWDASREATDDARMAMAAGFDVAIIDGDEALAKYTFASDFEGKSSHSNIMPAYRTGTGFDVHRLIAGEELWLCGIKIEHYKGLSGHSDADVALHALTDAIFGAAALGDIGDHFPPSDPQWRGASSDRFLAHAAKLAGDRNFSIENVDITIICEAPKIGPHRAAMRDRVADILGIELDRVSIKATTTEQLGYTGRGEGIAAQAIATLAKGRTAH
jgi:2-C-methyl-D-erythritol 4-phosphate cytidylyltransferase / 2-C-methyl-D-erythritol 2,4-cyclodiphosphate synthase